MKMAVYYQYPANNFGKNYFNPILKSNTNSVGTSNYVNTQTNYQYYRGDIPWGSGGVMAPQDFGRPVNPVSTRGGRLCLPNYTGTPRFSDLPTTLYWHQQNELLASQIQNQSEVQDRKMGKNHYVNQGWSLPGYVQNQLEVQNHPVNQFWALQGGHIQNQPEVQDCQLVAKENDRLEVEAEVKVKANENAHLEAVAKEKENLETNTEQKVTTMSEANKKIDNTNQTTVAVADTTTSGLVGEDLGMYQRYS